jgi:hypothetical protein
VTMSHSDLCFIKRRSNMERCKRAQNNSNVPQSMQLQKDNRAVDFREHSFTL